MSVPSQFHPHSSLTEQQTSFTDLSELSELKDASGAPRPVIVRRTRRTESADTATVLQLAQRETALRNRIADQQSVPRPVPVRSEPEIDPQVERVARMVAQGSLEVLGGIRPLQQMAGWMDVKSYERLQLRTNLVRCLANGAAGTNAAAPHRAALRLHRNISVRSVRICPLPYEVFEVSLVMMEKARVRAVALRIERRRGNWKATALEIG